MTMRERETGSDTATLPPSYCDDAQECGQDVPWTPLRRIRGSPKVATKLVRSPSDDGLSLGASDCSRLLLREERTVPRDPAEVVLRGEPGTGRVTRFDRAGDLEVLLHGVPGLGRITCAGGAVGVGQERVHRAHHQQEEG